MDFSEEQIAEYLQHRGVLCPHCKGKNVEADDMTYGDPDTAYQEVHCLSCHKGWTDIYKLSTITPS